MASKPVRLHPEAEREYLEALVWYRDRSAVVASDSELAVSKAVQAIETAPQRWPSYFGEFRRYTLHRFPFNIVYQEMLSDVVVFAVAHGRRRPGYWRKRVAV
ncbi:MAG: type II toxin-antitoxin system RelE/ParE family toxin [Terriglobales bacterium]|jgi:plasmid stabilization system protein ParE